MKKKMIVLGIALVAVLGVSLTLNGKESGNLKITAQQTQQAKMGPYWQKMPDCPVGFEGYVCAFTVYTYPGCSDHGNWACIER